MGRDSSTPELGGSAAEVAVSDEAPRQADIARRLVWLGAFRVAAVTVLVGATAVITLKGGDPLGETLAASLSGVAVATNLFQIALVLLVRRGRWLRRLALAQIAGDVAFACGLVYLTGGPDSLFTFLYLLAIVNGGILLSRSGAWFAAGLAFFAHCTLVVLLQLKWLPVALEATARSVSWPELYQAVFTHGAAFGLTAVIASYVASQLQSEGERADVAESHLSQLSVLHDAIVRSIGSGIATTDSDQRIEFLNRAGEEILGVSLAELQGRKLDEIFPTLASENSFERAEGSWSRPDGSVRVLGFTIHPLVDEQGERLGTTAVFQDLTPFRELQERAARSERLALVGELSAGLAHELRNPLASMCGSIEMLSITGAQTATDKRLFEIVLREADRLNALVSDFLAFARPTEPELKPISLAELVSDVLLMFRSDPAAVSLHIEEEVEDCLIQGDEAQIRQVLWNLLRNAAEASPNEGQISISARPEAGMVRLSIADEGPGIPVELRNRIFDPFFTTREKGTGLGLAIVHRIVDGHGGSILVASGLERGTTVTVFLSLFSDGVSHGSHPRL